MLFFCPLDNIHQPTLTTLAEQQAAIAKDGTRQRQGLCVEADSARAATDTITAYLLDCVRSGRSDYAPTVEIEDRDGVPVASLMEGAPIPTPAEAAGINALVDRAKGHKPKPPANDAGMAPAHVGSMPPDSAASSAPPNS
jgi:hypothetical protein